jgi:outer membrane protein TolC
MKKFQFIVLFCCIATWSYAAEITLDSCQSMARINHPLLRQAAILDQISELRQQNIETLNLPQFDLTARASWQSDVTKLALKMPGFAGPKPLSKDQYKTYIDIKQRIYDGGFAKKSKELEEADRLVSTQQNEIELYKIKETVNTLYFNALIIQKNLTILNLKKEILNEQIKSIRSGVENGVSLPNNLDQLIGEKLLTEQQEIELKSANSTTIGLMEIITGVSFTDQTTFAEPPLIGTVVNDELNRPEILLFTLQQSKLEKSEQVIRNTRNPFIYAFGQGGYGRPGFNMLENNFADFYLVGAGLSWNIWDWHKNRRDRSVIKLQKDLISSNLDNFTRSIQMALKQEENNASKITALISTDEKLVIIKEQITKRSSVALKNGMITSADFIRDLNAALQAKANLETHKIQLDQTMINYKTIKGNK